MDKVLLHYSIDVFLIARTVETRMKDKGKNIRFDMIYLRDVYYEIELIKYFTTKSFFMV